MTHRLLTLLIFLLAGAVVNVAVAWGSAVSGGFSTLPGDSYGVRSAGYGGLLGDDYIGTRWRVSTGERVNLLFGLGSAPETLARQMEMEGFIPRWGMHLVSDLRREVPDSEASRRAFHAKVVSRTIDARGWPLPALWGGLQTLTESQRARVWLQDEPVQRAFWAISLSRSRLGFIPPQQLRFLPLAPIWPSFAVDTLFYATLLWLLIPGPFVLRRFVRLRRGLCPKCAYPTGELGVCTECGHELPRRSMSFP